MFEEIKKELEEKLSKIKKKLENDFSEIIVSGAHPSLLNRVHIEYYGEIQQIKNLSNIVALDSEILIITPYDADSIKEISKAISHSNLNLNTSIDGKQIKIHVPKVTEERRKELVNKSKEYLEEAKIRIRTVRKETNNKIKSISSFSDNEIEIYSLEVQKLVDNLNKVFEDNFKNKKEELLRV